MLRSSSIIPQFCPIPHQLRVTQVLDFAAEEGTEVELDLVGEDFVAVDIQLRGVEAVVLNIYYVSKRRGQEGGSGERREEEEGRVQREFREETEGCRGGKGRLTIL